MMTNREKLKDAIERDIDPKSYFDEIIRRTSEESKIKNKNKIWKISLVPICLILVIGCVMFLNYNKLSFNKNSNIENDATKTALNINEMTDTKGLFYRSDVDVKSITISAEDLLLPYKNEKLYLPEDLNKTYVYKIYTKENKDSTEYDILNNYEIRYTDDDARSIQVSYSKEYEPIRDYYFSDEGSKTTMINEVELKIYRFEKIYFTRFKFNDYNFDIETSNITEQELSSFLLSILK